MIIGLAIAGTAFLLLGGAFYWLNRNTPVQTCIPAVALPIGAACLLVALGGWLL